MPARVLRVFGSAKRALRYLDAIERELRKGEPHQWKFKRTTTPASKQELISGQELGCLTLTSQDGKPGPSFVVERFRVERGPLSPTFREATGRLQEKTDHASSATKGGEH